MSFSQEESAAEIIEIEDDTTVSSILLPPSVQDHRDELIVGKSYSHYSAVPAGVDVNGKHDSSTQGTPVVLGVDEAGRGPVIGPMVYGIFYLPVVLHTTLLRDKYRFDDSKVLTPEVRARLMHKICEDTSDLFHGCGWAIKSLSARDISAGMLKAHGSYNLNAQAMDATVEVIRGVLNMGVNVTEVYIDTIGKPEVYQRKLEVLFPTLKIVVAKKADSLYPVVSAASVVAKVTRDVSCEVLYEAVSKDNVAENGVGWGSGYPSDARCITWMKGNVDPTFGFGSETRFSWGTVKDMLEHKGTNSLQVAWPDESLDRDQLSQYFGGANGVKTEAEELRGWYGKSTVSLF